MAHSSELTTQLGEQRRTVDFDTFDIQVQQLLTMLEEDQISIAPAYQRQFRWDEARCSQLVESLILGIPIPNLFMATNEDNSWEVVDGLQRLCAVVKFAGDATLRSKFKLGKELALTGLKKIDKFNDYTFRDLPPNVQQHIKTRPLKVVTLNDKSDIVVRFDLFERLNTGGIILTQQEIRACVYGSKFADKLDELSATSDFKSVVKLTEKQKTDGTAEECVLRFFAFLDKYMEFDHSVTEFLNGYMRDAMKFSNHDLAGRDREFSKVFRELGEVFSSGIMRPGRKGTTPLNLFEGIVVGAALAIREKGRLDIHSLDSWMASPELRKYTTGATNSPRQVRGRIHFCRDRFLGKPYVRPAAQRN